MENMEEINELLMTTCELCGLTDVPKECTSCILGVDKNGYRVEMQVCPMCFDQMKEQAEEYMKEQEEEYMTVTKEMAIDAGDRTLEGALIKW